jgi:lipoprotein-anchoring transpeptidase ErfK/SrfK
MSRTVTVIFSLISAGSAFAITPLDTSSQLIISVRDQKLMLVQNGGKVATYPVSTSMFGVGDSWGRMTTPLGYLAVEKKIGDNVPAGAVFHQRRLTGEILQPNAPGRDPVTTRIIWLRGLEAQNAHAFQRGIYIHGTPQEKTIGRPASYGCIRMKSSDVAELYNRVPVGAVVQIIPDRLPKTVQALPEQLTHTLVAATAPPQTQTDKRGRLPKLAKAPRVEPPNGGMVASDLAAPPQTQTDKRGRLAKVAKAARGEPTNSGIDVGALAAPPLHLTQNQPEAQPATRNHDQPGSKESTGTLTAEEMRMGGALAAQRQKAKLALNKRL